MPTVNLQGILAFIKNSENLKNTLRASFSSNGRQESTAEHSWRLCLFIMACAPLYPALKIEKLLKLAVLHDLSEAVCGDVPAPLQQEGDNKTQREREALITLTKQLPAETATEFRNLWEEYTQGSTQEAKLVKALDKLETLVQHNQGKNPPNFDYHFNLTYGSTHTATDPLLAELKKLIDEDTKRNIAGLPA